MKAVLFAGQGAQYPGMGADYFDLYPDHVWQASDILGYDVKELCLQNPDNKLGLTEYTQPALFLVNSLTYMAATERGERRADFYAGHSLGEYNALYAAGAFDFETGLRLVQKRGALMAEANGGGMAAILGIHPKKIEELLVAHQLTNIDLANYNSPTQTVVSGDIDELKQCETILSDAGVRCVMLDVSAPFHSRFMVSAENKYREFLAGLQFGDLRQPVISNVTAAPHCLSELRDNLSCQISHSVKWMASMRYLLAQGVDAFSEIGGKALSKMLAQIQDYDRQANDLASQELQHQESDRQELPSPAISSTTARSGSAPTSFVQSKNPTNISNETNTQASFNSPFCASYGVKLPYIASALPGRACSPEWVVELARSGVLGFLGTELSSAAQLREDIRAVQADLERQAYGVSLFCEHGMSAADREKIDCCLAHEVSCIQALDYVEPSMAMVLYRLKGLSVSRDTDGVKRVLSRHRLVVRVDDPQLAGRFFAPPSQDVVDELFRQRHISAEQRDNAKHISLCSELYYDASTFSDTAAGKLADMQRESESYKRQYNYAEKINLGVAAGFGDPRSVAEFFSLDVDFIVTDSINQCTLEANLPVTLKDSLASCSAADIVMAPAHEKFILGLKSPILNLDNCYPERANYLFDLYAQYEDLTHVPRDAVEYMERDIFGESLENVWLSVSSRLIESGRGEHVRRAARSEKYKMLLVFSSYLDRIRAVNLNENPEEFFLTINEGMGRFNEWSMGTNFTHWKQRHASEIASALMSAVTQPY